MDDEPAVLQVYSQILRSDGYEVLEAPNGRRGLELVRQNRPDLVLLDVVLPDLNGLEACRIIKADAALKDIFIILISGCAFTPSERVNGLEAGADEYLIKPLTMDELLARVRTVLRLQETTAALRASEEHYRGLIEILPDAICLVSLDGRLTGINQQAMRTLGFEASEQILQSSFFDFLPQACHDRFRADISSTLSHGSVRGRDYPLARKNGELILGELNITTLSDVAGQVTGLVIVVHDITERQKIKQSLAEALELNQTMMAASAIGILAYRASGQCVFANQASSRIINASLKELLRQNFRRLSSWKGSGLLKLAETALHSKSVQIGEIQGRTYSGKEFWIDCQMAPFISGGEQHLLCLMNDISERKQSEKTLIEIQHRHKVMLDSISDPAWLKDEAGIFLDCNEASAEFYGRTREEIIGKTIFDLAPDAAEQLAREDEEVMRSRRLTLFERPLVDTTGQTKWFETSISPVLDGQGRFIGIVGIARDITKRKQTEEKLRTIQRRIIEAQEAERWRVARELHDGINQIIASARMRLCKVVDSKTMPLNPAAREILTRCDKLLNKALEENRRIARNLRPVDLDELGFVEATKSLCKEVQSKNSITVECRIQGLNLRLDPAIELGLFRIVQEALSNVEKHAKAENVQVLIALDGGFLLLRIQDDGRGFDMPPNTSPFSKKGGLGLRNMRERATSLNGSCEITSKPNQGTVIMVRVPCPRRTE